MDINHSQPPPQQHYVYKINPGLLRVIPETLAEALLFECVETSEN